MSEENLALPVELMSKVERYAVYRCYSDQGVLLYIGESGELGRRLASHAQKVWFLEVRGITLEWYADELSALNAEHRAIHVERPKHNVQSRSKPFARKPARTRSHGHRPTGERADAATARAKALIILAKEPGISGAKLGDQLGRSERWGQLRKKELAGSATGPDEDERTDG